MLLFCPACANTLTVSRAKPLPTSDDTSLGPNRLECRSCPYQFVLTKRFYERQLMKRKEVEDVMGGAGAWDNVDQTDAQCQAEGCEGSRAYFYQVQIRSADEPMTTFYKCTECGAIRREN